MSKSAKKRTANVTTDEHSTLLTAKLSELKLRLKKSFRSELIEAVCYFIKIENQRQTELESSVREFDWTKLDYFLQQFKKICKQKPHLILLTQKLQLSGMCAAKTSEFKTTKSDALNDETRVELVAELDDLSNVNDEHFSLIRIMIRFLFKLFKFNSYDNKKRLEFVDDESKLFDLQLLLLSCLADLCYYEELRIQVCVRVFSFENLYVS